MTSSTAFLVFGFLAIAAAAPWPSNPPRCSTECPIAGSPKLAYAPEKTYLYSYTGKSQVYLKDVEGGKADMEWSSQVELSWLTPCDVAISLKSPSIAGASSSPEARFLERYPLVVAMIDGRVQQTCHHPEDDVWSINLKKGIASAFQNSLPSNSSINSGLNITETDIIGNCSTMYEVDNQGERVLVKKMKNHRYCQDLYVSSAETPKVWPKAPLPFEESMSECKQEVTKGIYTSITCKDRKIITPMQGSYKHIETYQEAALRFQSETDQVPSSVSNLRGPLVRKSLRHDQQTLKKDASMVAKLDETLKQVCEKIEGGVKEDAATHVAKALHFLRKVPEEAIQQTLQKIRSGQFCGNHQKLESLFLDSLAFIQESGAVKVMVEELLSGKATGGRSALYTAALYMMPRPCIHSVEAVKPLIENYQRFPRMAVAAASMVNMYCRQIPNCQQQASVRQIAERLSSKVSEKCSAPGDEHTREEALVILKALANMGVMTSEVARPIIQCIEKEDADNSIRMAATQTFRNIHCPSEIKPVMKQLVNIVVDPRKETEVRIGSYLAAMKCPDYENLQKVIRQLSHEENTQVRDFVLSHLHNVQESGAPHKEDLKYLLTTIVIPSNFTSDWRTTSRNIDLSYYAPTFGAGAGMESNVIFAPGSFIPRFLSFNLTAALGATPINIGEIGARIEGLEPIMENLFGPEGYMKTTPTSEVFQHIWSSMEDKLSMVKGRIQGAFRQKRSIDFSTVSRLFDKLYGDKRSRFPKADLFARINDQEIAFASLAGDLSKVNIDQLINRFFDSVDEMINNAAHADLDVVRGAQIFLDYHVPTMAGMPIKMKLEGTAVAGIKIETRLNGLSGGSPNVIKFIPTLSTQVDGFVGFDSHIAKAGVKMSSTVSTNTGASINLKNSGTNAFELEVEVPEKMELINLKSETYLVKVLKGQQETKIQPPSVRPTRVQKQSCLRALEPVLGIKLCYDVNMPNIFRSEGLPLGPPTIAKLFLEKSDSSMKGYLMKTHVQNAEGKKEINVEVGTPGSSTPRKANVVLAYSREGDMNKVSCVLESHSLGGVKMEFKKKWSESEKLLQFDAYGSRSQQYSPESKVIEAKFQMNDDGHDIKVDSFIQSLSTIKQYLDVNIEVSGDFRYSEESRIPIPKRLRKFEFNVGLQRWHLVSYIRKVSDSEFTSAIIIGAKSNGIVVVVTTHNIGGSMKAKLGVSQYKGLQDLHFTDLHFTDLHFTDLHFTDLHFTDALVARQSDSSKMIEAEVTAVISEGENYKLKLLLDVPAYFNAVKLDASATHQGSSQYQIVVDVKHGGNTLFLVEGPVKAQASSEITQLQTQLQVICLRSEPHIISMTVLFAPTKQAVVFGFLRQSERLMAVEWTMATQDEQETKVDFKLVIPSLVEKSIKASISRKALHVSVNQLVSPRNSPQRMKGFLDIDFEGKKSQVQFAWDADRAPNKKFKAEVAVIGSSSTLRNLAIQGAWTFIESQYQFKSEMSLADPRTWFSGRNTMKLEFTTPSHRTYECESVVNIDNQPSTLKVDTTNSIKTPERQEYRVKSESSLERLGGYGNMKVTTRMHFTSPQGHQSEVTIEAQHHKSVAQREAYVMVHVTSPSLHQPLQTKVMLVNQQNQYSTKWMIEGSSPAVGAMYDLTLSPEGGVQSFKTEMNLKAIAQLMKSIENIVSSSPSSVSGGHGASSGIYVFHYHRSTPTSLYKTPSHTSDSLLYKTPSHTSDSLLYKTPSHTSDSLLYKTPSHTSDSLLYKTPSHTSDSLLYKTPSHTSDSLLYKTPSHTSDSLLYKTPSHTSDSLLYKTPSHTSDSLLYKTPSHTSDSLLYKTPSHTSDSLLYKTPSHTSDSLLYKTPSHTSDSLLYKTPSHTSDSLLYKTPSHTSDSLLYKTPSHTSDSLLYKTPSHTSDSLLYKTPSHTSDSLLYKTPSHTTHSFLYKTPSRTMEGEAEFSPSKIHMKLNPHKGVTDTKYELYAEHSHSDWDRTSKVEGRISHPSLVRDMQVNVQYGSNGQRITGSIELDIFPNSEDKVSGKLESLIYARNTVAIDAHLSGKALKVNPKVHVYASYGRNTLGFDIKFHKTPSAPVSFLMSGKFDKSSGRNAAISFIVQSEGQTAMDVAISSRPERTPTCYGIKVEAKAKSSIVGSYDIFMNLCEPLRIEMATRKHDSETIYITKAGMRGMKDAEVSVSEEKYRTGERTVLGMIKAHLTSSSMVKFETKYESEKLHNIKRDVKEKWSRLVSAAGSWLDNMSREVLKEGGSPSSKMSMLWQEIKAEASGIYEDLKYDLDNPRIERIMQWMESDFIRGVAAAYSKLWSQYTEVKREMSSLVSIALRKIESEFGSAKTTISEVVVGCARWLETGETPEVLRRMLNEIQESSVYRRVQSEIDSIGNQYPEEYQGFRQIVEKVKATLVKELEEQRQSIMYHRKPQQMANWVMNHMNVEKMVFNSFNRIVKAVVQNALFFNVQIDGNHMQLELPTYRPVRSLAQAAAYVSLSPVPSINVGYWGIEAFLPTPVDNLIWTYYKFLPRHARYLVPPFNRTAAVIDGTEIMTFDGVVLRAPHSPCKVLLAEHKYGSLVMQNQQPNALPHLVMKESGVTVEVKPDFTILVNGRPASGPHQTEGKVRIHMESEKVEIMAPILTLRVYKASHTATVEASGWAFGQMAGLLGTFDGEKGNDWVTPSGSRPSTLQELVKAWQEDQGCSTPNVSPVSPLQTPVVHMIHCNTFFGFQTRCNAIIRPEPFIKMCYNSKDACHVARAYSAVCATKGVKDVFPLAC